MALVLDATVGGASANVYCTLAEANTYHETRLFSTAWTGAVGADTTRNAALVWATRLLDLLIVWAEYPAATTQALQWPRTGILDALKLSNIPSTVIPVELKNATAEFARQLIPSDRTADFGPEAKGIKSFTAGPVSFEFKELIIPKVVPDSVAAMLPPHWGYVRGRMARSIEVVRA